MRAVLLDGTPSGHDACRPASDALRRAFSECGHQVESFVLADLPMSPCRGCFACWTATPGRCPVPDASEVVARAVANADLAAVFSPLAFGGWNWIVKKVLDRMICLLSPRFEAKGLTRHKARYETYPAFLGAGWLPAPDPQAEAVFARLAEHNAYNLRAPSFTALALHGDKPWAALREECLAVLADPYRWGKPMGGGRC